MTVLVPGRRPCGHFSTPAPTLAWAQDTGADLAKTNVNGNAIAIGHPLGATKVAHLHDRFEHHASVDFEEAEYEHV